MKKIYTILIIAFCVNLSIFAQNIIISKTIIADTVVANVRNSNVVGKTISVSGTVIFSGNSGFLRILLSNDDGYDLLIYESFPLITDNGTDNFSNQAFETRNVPSYLDFSKIRVKISNANLNNLTINISQSSRVSLPALSSVRSSVITKINDNLQANHALWRAGETSVSQMTYEEKKNLFGGTVPPLNGFDYYSGGVFEDIPFEFQDSIAGTSHYVSNYIDEFDWRNRHGQNWHTSVKNQDACGACAVFAATGAVEAVANLYYNQHLDLDLSEQQIVSCAPGAGHCAGAWNPDTVLNFYKNTGVINEECFQYQWTDLPCDNSCTNPSERVKITGAIALSNLNPLVNKEDSLKKMLIEFGPVNLALGSWGHAMTLSGFGKIKVGMPICDGNGNISPPLSVLDDDPRIGQTYWIFKNSWGTDWGDNGWCYVNITKLFKISNSWTHATLTPITSLNYTDADIRCVDEDGDGYYWWGIGPKPATCPLCRDEPDCDDSDPTVGPMDESGNCTPIINLSVRDDISDVGIEPSNVVDFSHSPDIWVRNHNDNGTEPQNPEYSPTAPNWAHVRVTNRGGYYAGGSANLKLYWAKASTALYWDYYWTGNTFENSTALLGNIIGTLTIPALEPNEDVILKFPWLVPNPADYESINAEPWHFCLLARIESDDDPMNYTETQDLADNIVNNNNIALSNLTVVDVVSNKITSTLAVGNVYSTNHTYDLVFKSPTNESGKKVQEEAEVSIKLDNAVSSKWQQSGKQGTYVEEKNNNKILVKGANATLTNLTFSPNEINTINLSFNFLTQQVSNKESYTYSVLLKDSETGKIIGSENYLIKREPRNLFRASAGGNIEVERNETFTLNAELISEDAIYNWYDGNDSLIYEGADFTTSTAIGQYYLLEVIALADGYKDYAEVAVTIKPNSITNLYPNPATNFVNIEYSISDAQSAYISVINYYNPQISNNYILDINSTSISFNTQNLPTGIYVTTLICDGQVADSKILVKQ